VVILGHLIEALLDSVYLLLHAPHLLLDAP